MFGDTLLTSSHRFSEEEYALRLNYILFNLLLLFDTVFLMVAAALTIEAIITVLEKPLIVEEHILFPVCSMGCSIFPNDGLTETELLRKADIAMYRAKKDTERKYCFFNPDLPSG